jgi:serine/threonine protein kinase
VCLSKPIDDLDEYKDVLVKLETNGFNTKELASKYYSDKALSLFNNLCEVKANMRYQCSTALRHPWITREESGAIPLNILDQFEQTNKLFDKFKHTQALIVAIAVLRNETMKKDMSKILDAYKCRIIKEEFLEFTPTPKEQDKNSDSDDCFSKHFSIDFDDKDDSTEIFLRRIPRNKLNTKKSTNDSKFLLHPDLVIRTMVCVYSLKCLAEKLQPKQE